LGGVEVSFEDSEGVELGCVYRLRRERFYGLSSGCPETGGNGWGRYVELMGGRGFKPGLRMWGPVMGNPGRFCKKRRRGSQNP